MVVVVVPVDVDEPVVPVLPVEDPVVVVGVPVEVDEPIVVLVPPVDDELGVVVDPVGVVEPDDVVDVIPSDASETSWWSGGPPAGKSPFLISVPFPRSPPAQVR